MTCPACSGKGYRLLYINADEGLCPDCGGAGTVKGADQNASWVYNYVTCKSCSGRGIKPIKSGGTREGMVLASTGRPPGAGDPGGDQGEDEVDKEADEGEDETSSSDGGGFLLKYRWYLVAGGGGLLALAFVASKTSKKTGK